MKIVSFQEFCKLPDNTVFHPLDEHGNVGELSIRGEIIYSDGEPVDYAEAVLTPRKHRVSIESHTGWGRWALFDYDTKYLVYLDADRQRLAGWLLDPDRAANEINDEPQSF
jgi:hypothetical protein